MKVIGGLDGLPRSADLHEWADFAELLCCVHPDRQLTRADLIERVRRAKDVAAEANAEVGGGTGEDAGDPPAEVSDHWYRRADDTFAHMHARETALPDSYPFELSGDGSLEVLQRRENLSEPQKLYLLLLVAANLRYARSHTDPITTAFEVVAGNTMRQLVPAGGVVHHFGPRHEGARYEGLLFAKIEKLAEDLRERLVSVESDFKAGDTGDGGLDLVGWCDPRDDECTRVLLFGQCACTDEWVEKQHSSGAVSWQARIAFRAAPMNMTFIPHLFRNAQLKWAAPDKIRQTVLYDRVRILRALQAGGAAALPGAVNNLISALATETEDD